MGIRLIFAANRWRQVTPDHLCFPVTDQSEGAVAKPEVHVQREGIYAQWGARERPRLKKRIQAPRAKDRAPA